MRNILAPVDFSDEASNAAHFAAELAKQIGAELTLLYVFHVPVPISEVPYPIDFTRLEQENKELLDNLSAEIERTHHLKPKQISVPGFAVDEILDIVGGSEFDLIVMGMRGAGNKLSYLLGSTATAVMRKSPLPVLAVPGNAHFTVPRHIVLTCDFHQVNHPEIFKVLTGFCRRFHSDVALLNVFAPGELPERKKAVEGIRLEHYLEGVEHRFCFEEEENVEMGVENYLNENPSDMLVIIPHEHNVIDRLFFKTHSKKLMLHATIPVLTLPDRKNAPHSGKPEMNKSML
jgi:nucleotide-binding universal stress UspA family protein